MVMLFKGSGIPTCVVRASKYHVVQEVLSLQPMFPPKPLDTLPLEVDAQKV